MKRPFAAAIIVIAMLEISCSSNSPTSPSTITGSGTMETETRTHDTFDSVSLRITGRLELTYGTEQSVTVTVDDNIIDKIETLVRDGVLMIRSNTADDLDYDSLVVRITMTDLKSIAVPSVGTVKTINQFDVDDVSLDFTGTVTAILDLKVNSLTTVAAGVTTLILNGSADTHECDLTGTTMISAYGFSTTSTDITVEGTGEIQLQASDQLTVVISGVGNVHYKGHPNINSTITGLGSLTDAN